MVRGGFGGQRVLITLGPARACRPLCTSPESVMTTGSSSIAGLLVLGIVFHLVYIGTVFDCYFASPVVHGMRQYKLPQAQAKRLVLIVGAQTQPPPGLFEGLLTSFLALFR